jgi:hypothetical protein
VVYKMLYTNTMLLSDLRGKHKLSHPSAGGDKVEKLKPGDRVWVKTPRLVAERKIGTIMGTKKTSKGLRYIIEWDVDLLETPNHHPGYLATEIAPMGRRNVNQ